MVFLDNDPSPCHQGITLATEKTLNYSRQAHTFEPFVNLGKREKGLPSTETSSKKVSHNSFPSHVWPLLFFNRHFSCFSPFFRTCQMRVVRFYVRPSPPSSPSHPPSCPCQPRSPTASVLCAPQPPSCAASVPCWTSTAILCCKCSLLDLNRDPPLPAFPAGHQPAERMSEEMPERMSESMGEDVLERLSERMSEQMSERVSETDGRKIGENRCQKECQRQMAERLSERMSEEMSERMSEEIAVGCCLFPASCKQPGGGGDEAGRKFN